MFSQQTPKEEMAEKVAEATGLAVAGRAVGLEDHRAMLHDHRGRVRDSHKAMAKAAGMGDEVTNPKVEDMGDISVAGDTYNVNQPAPQGPPQPGMPTWAKLLGTAALAAGTGAGGVAGYNALTADDEPLPVTAEPAGDRWMEYTIEKWTPDK